MDGYDEGLTPEDLLQEDHLETFLSGYYTVDSEGENSKGISPHYTRA